MVQMENQEETETIIMEEIMSFRMTMCGMKMVKESQILSHQTLRIKLIQIGVFWKQV